MKRKPAALPVSGARSSGFSLMEMVLVAALLTLALGPVFLVTKTGDRMYRTESVVSHLEFQAAQAMEHVLDDLTIAGNDTFVPALVPGVATSSVQYVLTDGLVNGQVAWTPLRRLELEYESGEVDDGIDNNGNGLIDEGQLILTEDVGGPNEQRRVLTRWVPERFRGELENGLDDNGNGLVDERGFCVERIGNALIVRLALQRRTAEGALVNRAAQSSIEPRNRRNP